MAYGCLLAKIAQIYLECAQNANKSCLELIHYGTGPFDCYSHYIYLKMLLLMLKLVRNLLSSNINTQ